VVRHQRGALLVRLGAVQRAPIHRLLEDVLPSRDGLVIHEPASTVDLRKTSRKRKKERKREREKETEREKERKKRERAMRETERERERGRERGRERERELGLTACISRRRCVW
jgi:hypothetical protein